MSRAASAELLLLPLVLLLLPLGTVAAVISLM